MSHDERDYYDILGVPRDADKKTIKEAYHRLAMKWHPDRNKSPDAEAKFKDIAKAYAILSDPNKRARYDAHGFEGVAHFSQEDLFRNADLGSLFGDLGFGFGPGGESIFDRFFGRTRHTQTAKGEDIQLRLEVPLNQIAEGGEHTLQFSRPVSCPHCHGHGTYNGKPPPVCPACNGSGHRVVQSQQSQGDERTIHFQQVLTCPKCHGRGISPTEACHYCHGTGEIKEPETLKLKIPKGIEDGMTLRIPKHGLPGKQPGSEPGNLYVTIYSIPDPRFQRRGADLWRSETLRIEEAVLGAKHSVPTLNGEVEVNIPPGVQPDTVLRLRGKGLPRYQDDSFGNLNLRLQVNIPTELSEQERQLFEQLRELNNKSNY